MSDILFPDPSPPPSTLSPTTWPGISPEATAVLRRVLKDNHERFHIFFNEKGFHNHAAHHIIAIWALGANGPLIDAAYELHFAFERPAFKSPEPITTLNFHEHLGDQKFYNAYLGFYTDILLKKGAAATLEEHIFSQKANFDPEGRHHQMLGRFMEGIMHSFIHTGYGVEFGLLGMVAEGLAQAAVHASNSTVLIPPSLFESNIVAGLENIVSRLVLNNITPIAKKTSSGTHAFTIMARILKDPAFGNKAQSSEASIYRDVLAANGDALVKYAEEWKLNISDPNDLKAKIEELVWMNAIIYGIGGWNEGDDFKADFFTMHLVTSSIFLSSLSAYLTPSSQSIFLTSYFRVSLAWWVARGRPGFDIPEYFSAKTSCPVMPGPYPIPSEVTLPNTSFSMGNFFGLSKASNGSSLSPSEYTPEMLTPNPWLPIIQSTLLHPDDHLCKMQRALAHFANLYGGRTPGLPDFAETELPGAERLDGTLFIRIAGLTAQKLGRVREGEKYVFWGR